jgi:hypothetical protein
LAFARSSDEAVNALLASRTDLQIQLEVMVGLDHAKKAGAERMQLSA